MKEENNSLTQDIKLYYQDFTTGKGCVLFQISKKPNKHKCLKTKNGTISISRHIYKGTDGIHSKSDR